ncbi:hypothetical protein P5V15_004575 [Pogonomyrmex californicus]
MEMEIICISSDDETNSQKENETKESKVNCIEANNGSIISGKLEVLFNNDEKVEEHHLKRKNEEKIIHNNMEKKIKLNTNQETFKVINKLDLDSTYVRQEASVRSNNNVQSKEEQEVIAEKTQLIVKEKKKISYIPHDVFPLFISLCLQKCPEYDKTDMEKIIDKLKRRYENLDPLYVRSENFVSFLNEKREAIMKDGKKIYVHIEEVMNEMKKKIKKNTQCNGILQNETYDAIPSTSFATYNTSINNEIESDCDDDDDNNNEETLKTRRKIKQVLHAMKKCESIIKKLEDAEVDFNEENDSNYIKVERYKRKMVELYSKLCELTGENADAGRTYLRPKHLNTTQIVAVDQAITSFINSKIIKRNEMKKNRALTDDIIFPDYRDILECVTRCNHKRNLCLDRKTQEQIAKKAFRELGEHLQRARRNDYWDTFSLYLENSEDPAVKDKNLAKKLSDNRIEGEKRLAAVFDKYTKKQEEIKDQINENTTSEEDEDEEESIIEDKNEDNLSLISEKDSDVEEDMNSTVKENELSMEKSKLNTNVTNIYRATDKTISNKTTVKIIPEECIKKVKIKTVEKNAAVSKNETRTVSEKIKKLCDSNTISIIKKIGETKIQEDLLPAFSTTNCTSEDLAVMETDVPKITDPATKKISEGIADAVTRKMTAMSTDITAELRIKDTAEELRTEDTVELTTENVIKLTGNVAKTNDIPKVITKNMMDEVIDMPNDEQPEGKKPLLRLRSFAKPPMTWEDTQHKTEKTIQENAPKVTDQIKEVVDLTNESNQINTTKLIPINKCVLQVGDKLVPLVKSPTKLVPSNSNIITVQNITNNYLKVNTRTGQIIAPVRDIRAGSTIIRLPIQTATRQNQLQNVNAVTVTNDVTFKGNKETVLQIIQPKIIVSKKATAQFISKPTEVSSSKTKSK